MARAASSAVATVTVALVTSISQASVEVRHEPLECVPLSTAARLSARALPEKQVARVEVQFRVDPTAGWYSLLMVRDDGGWSGRLPRSVSPLERFEYRIVVTAADLGVVETPIVVVRVSPPGAPCERDSNPSTTDESPIAVRVPAGAPVMPPVPAGFSPAGVVAVIDPVKERGKVAKLATLGGIAAGSVAGIALVTTAASGEPTDPEPPPRTPPSFSIFAYEPLPNSTLSLSSGRVAFNVRVAGAVGVPLSFTWRLEFRRSADVCLTMGGEAGVGPSRPENVILTGPMMPVGACGSRFDVDTGTLTILVDGQVAFEWTGRRLIHVEP